MRFLFFRKKDAPRQGVLWQLKTHDREHLKTKHCHQCVLLRIENIWRKFSWRGSLCLLKAVYFELLSSQLPSRTEICDFRSHLGTHTHTHTHTHHLLRLPSFLLLRLLMFLFFFLITLQKILSIKSLTKHYYQFNSNLFVNDNVNCIALFTIQIVAKQLYRKCLHHI